MKLTRYTSVLTAAALLCALAQTMPYAAAATAEPAVRITAAAAEDDPPAPAEDGAEAPAVAAEGSIGENYTWQLDENGLAVISGSGEMPQNEQNLFGQYANAVKAAEFRCTDPEAPISRIPGYLFSGCKNLASVTLPDTVTEIGERAFFDCAALTALAFPEKLASIGERAFRGAGLTAVTLPGCTLGTEAFYNCAALEQVSIGEGTTEIPAECFRACSALKSVYLPDSVTLIACGFYSDSGAFSDCPALTSVSIGAGIQTINRYAFRTTGTGLEVTFRSGAKLVPEGAFYSCTALSAVTLPDTVKSIGQNAFRECSNLTQIKIPASVTEIGEQAFRSSGLTAAVLPGAVLGNAAFFDCASLKSVSIGEGTLKIPSECFRLCSALETVYLSDGVKEIGCGFYSDSGAFADCPALMSVSIGAGIESISRYAFRTTGEALCVTFRDGVTAIPAEAFAGRTELTAVILPDTLETIGVRAFQNCSNLTGVEFPDTVTSIGEQAFRGTALTAAILPGCALGDAAFFGCEQLVKVSVGDGAESIPCECFRACPALKYVYLADTVKSIGCGFYSECGAFADCPALADVSIGAGIESISRYAFRTTGEGLNITFREGVTAIPPEAFVDRPELASVSLPDTLVSVGKYAFKSCGNLTGVTFPESLKEIGEQAFLGTAITEANLPGCTLGNAAFYNCTALKTVTIGEGTEIIPSECFRACRSLQTVYLPDSVKDITCGFYSECGAFADCPSLLYVSIGKGIESINSFAFRTRGTELEVVFREGVTEIPNQAFEHSPLSKIVLPESLETLGERALYGCTNLTAVCIYSADCVIADAENTIPADAYIYGYYDSTAEAYADTYGRVFIPLKEKDPDAPFRCDLNGDGKTDMDDAALLLRYLAEDPTAAAELAEDAVLYAADLDCTGVLTMRDYRLLVRAIQNL